MLGMIWAQAHRRAIGRSGKMPWHLPEDLAFFKRVTLGSPVIMGRRTWESLTLRPLPGRANIVVSRSGFTDDGAITAASLQEAVQLANAFAQGHGGIPGQNAAGVSGERHQANSGGITWVMGGAQIYAAAMEIADGAVVTDLNIDVPDADAFAPAIPFDWEVAAVSPERGWRRARNGVEYRFSVYRRPGTKFAIKIPDIDIPQK